MQYKSLLINNNYFFLLQQRDYIKEKDYKRQHVQSNKLDNKGMKALYQIKTKKNN